MAKTTGINSIDNHLCENECRDSRISAAGNYEENIILFYEEMNVVEMLGVVFKRI
jgi:hypothetical protein